MKKNINEEPITWAAIDMDEKRQIRVISDPFRGKMKFHIREFFRRSLDNIHYLPGRGIAFQPECLDEVIEALILMQTEYESGVSGTKTD